MLKADAVASSIFLWTATAECAKQSKKQLRNYCPEAMKMDGL